MPADEVLVEWGALPAQEMQAVERRVVEALPQRPPIQDRPLPQEKTVSPDAAPERVERGQVEVDESDVASGSADNVTVVR